VADLYVLDTHVVIWYFIGSRRLRSGLKDKIDETRNSNGRLLVPTIVLVEALNVAEKGRIKFDSLREKPLLTLPSSWCVLEISDVSWLVAASLQSLPLIT